MPRRERWTRDGVFEPNDLKKMGKAYEQAISALDADAGPYANVPREQRRAMIADAILIAARRGIRDTARLEQQALKTLAKFATRQNTRLRSAPQTGRAPGGAQTSLVPAQNVRTQNSIRPRQGTDRKTDVSNVASVVTPEEIRARAYDLWERNHRPQGYEIEFWVMAERELKAERAAILKAAGHLPE